MSTVVEALSDLLNFPENLERFFLNSPNSRPTDHTNHHHRSAVTVPTDIIGTDKQFIFYMDVPGLSKSDIQVSVEDENTLVVRSNGKRKREDGEEEGCKYVRLERRSAQKVIRKFRLPNICDVAKITAKCENGVLKVVVEKLPPPPKVKNVEIVIS